MEEYSIFNPFLLNSFFFLIVSSITVVRRPHRTALLLVYGNCYPTQGNIFILFLCSLLSPFFIFLFLFIFDSVFSPHSPYLHLLGMSMFGET